jgi:DNA-binding NarL/FixJ family response regulator
MSIVEGDLANAAASIRQYLETAIHYNMSQVSTESIDATAAIAVHSGSIELGARLFGTADRANSDADYAIQFPERPIYEVAREAARQSMGDARFSELYLAGSHVTFDAVIPLIRDFLDSTAAGRPPGALSGERLVTNPSGLLTPREREVLQLVASGMSDREIGDRLFISHRTARTHVSNILGKLDVPSRSAATSFALREGLVRLEDAQR